MIENVLYNHLLNDSQLSPLLNQYDNKAAVFLQFIPNDTAEEWNNSNHYPQLVFYIDTSGDAARKAAGMLSIDIICNGSEKKSLEEITSTLKQSVDGYFFTNESGDTFAAAWERTDGFSTEPGNKLYGNTVTFSLLAFPKQSALPPDPINLLSNWMKETLDDSTVIGLDSLPEVFKPTDSKPAVYLSFSGQTISNTYPSNYFVTWMDVDIRLHVMAETKSVQDDILRSVMQLLAQQKRVMFSTGDDASPFNINRLTGTFSSDPIRIGQLLIEGTYGVLNQKDVPKINHLTIDSKEN